MNLALTFGLSFVIVLAVIAGMAIGILNGRRPIRGSCGGLNGAEGCGLCSGRCDDPSRDDAAGFSHAATPPGEAKGQR